MTDTTTITEAGKPPRESVADRQWVDAQNVEVEDPALATGCRYVDLDTKAAFVYQSGLPAGQHATMLAVFGALTKAGNIRNTLNKSKGVTDGRELIQGIEDWFAELIDNGNWAADRVGGGMRFNAEVLAKAIAHVKGEHGETAHHPYLDKIQNKAKVRDPGDKTGKKEILYATFAYRNTQVKNRYHETLPSDAAAPSASDL